MRTWFRLSLVAFALIATLGHVCVLPGHAHEAPVAEGHGHDESRTDDHGSPADGAHVASCEALRPPGGVLAAPTLVGGPSIVAPAAVTYRLIERGVDTPPPTASPPLYLTHRSLRI